MRAYEFWYMSQPNGRIQYIYIIADNFREAIWLFRKRGYTKMYDFGTAPLRVIPEYKWQAEHRRGDVLGELAVI